MSQNLWHNRTVGLLGGSFNPAHEGHRHISLYALKMLGLDAVWWMVSPQNPLKPVKGMAPLEQRVDKAIAVSNNPKIFVTDIETRFGTQFTADTLTALRQHFPTTRFIWLMGTDNLQQVHRWERWEEIFQTVPVCVIDRPPRHISVRNSVAAQRFRPYLRPMERAAALKWAKAPAWCILHTPLNNTSATEIRNKAKK